MAYQRKNNMNFTKMKRMASNHVSAFLSVVVLIALLALSGCSCSPAQESTPPAYESPYDWSKVTKENGRFSYTKDWAPASLTGIDVSEHQKIISWQAVAADGIDFAIIRVGNRGYTEGETRLDKYLYENIDGAKKAGLKIGVYFFSQAINEDEAIEEAQLITRALEGIRLDYPVFYDYEHIDDFDGRANKISNEQLTKNTVAFCQQVEKDGYTAMIYGNKKIMERVDKEVRDRYGVWLAEYGVERPTAQFDFLIWQYTSTGKVNGIETDVDLNIHFLYH